MATEDLIKKYAKLLQTKVLKVRESTERKNASVFVLASGQKLDMTEAELKAAITKLESKEEDDAVGTVGDGDEQAAASPESASRAPKNKKKEGN